MHTKFKAVGFFFCCFLSLPLNISQSRKHSPKIKNTNICTINMFITSKRREGFKLGQQYEKKGLKTHFPQHHYLNF